MREAPDERGKALVYAGFWVRVWASIVDSILVACILIPVLMLIPGAITDHVEQLRIGGTQLAYTTSQIALPMPVQILLFWVMPAIAVVVFWIFREATPGKMLISARIVDSNTGGHPSTGQLIGRYFGYFVSTIPLCLGLIWVGLDRRKQGWHDKLAHTVVIRQLKDNTPDFAAAESNRA